MPIRRLLPALGLVIVLLAPGVVAAHAELTASIPEAGAVLQAPPADVELTFDDELDPNGSALSVTDPTGARVARGGVDLEVADRNVLRAPMPASAAGRYEVAWIAVAADGHVESGTFTFTVVAPEPAAPDTAMATRSSSLLAGVALLIGALIVTGRILTTHRAS